MYVSSAFSLSNPFFMYVPTLCLQDYKRACGAFLDGLRLEPGNVEMEDGLRYRTCPFKSRKTRRSLVFGLAVVIVYCDNLSMIFLYFLS